MTPVPTPRPVASRNGPRQAGDHDPRASELRHFLGRYHGPTRPEANRAPDLADSLAVFAGLHARLGAAGLPAPGCRCLVEGYAAPGNARALREFLGARGVAEAAVVAVDLYDLPATYEELGIPRPPMEFRRGDACDLGDGFPDGSVDLVVQDFLLNCVPCADAGRVLAEASRVLRSGGLAFVSFTDIGCLAPLPWMPPDEVEAACGAAWNPRARSLADLAPGPDAAARMAAVLGGRVVGRRDEDEGVFVTRPHGRFEYFAGLARTLARMGRAGLELLAHAEGTGRDDHGLECRRHRVILRKTPPA